MSDRLSAISASALPDQRPLPATPADSTNSSSRSPAPVRRPSPPNADRTRSRSPAPSRLHKALPNRMHARAASGHFLATPSEPSQPSLEELKQQVAQTDHFGVPRPPLPLPLVGASPNSRSSSRDGSAAESRPGTPVSGGSRPVTPTTSGQSPRTPTSASTKNADLGKERKKHWWSSSKKMETVRGPPAWVAGHSERPAYDGNGLLHGRPMPELWDEMDGNCFVYLFPRSSGKGPSFKIDSAIFASSPAMTRMAFGDLYSHKAVVSEDRIAMPQDARTHALNLNPSESRTPPETSQRPLDPLSSTSSHSHLSNLSESSPSGRRAVHIYLPLKLAASPQEPVNPQSTPAQQPDDLQILVDYRNFFAFLSGQSLIATAKRSAMFHIFMTIASLLKVYEFGNLDGSTFGEVASLSFDKYVDELGLNDVRTSREATIEGLVLGEKMKSVRLYNEAFTHAAGKLDNITALKSPKFELVSETSKNRLIRASMDLEKRTASIRLILTDFEFPSIFSGIMASKMAGERKEGVRFDDWKDAFLGFRRWYAGLLKHKYGAWPPKASSKKNELETSGLNRLVLRDVYQDMGAMYDYLVDRTSLTTRTVNGIDLAGAREEPTIRAMRAVLSEYDRSSPPVKPPVPFDLPLLPNLRTTRPEFGTGDKKKDIKALQKKLKDEEIALLLRASSNLDVPSAPFLDAFRAMEAKAAHGCTIGELADLRLGWWVFMYAVLQALPLLVVDAQQLKHTQGCEYFLCEPPRGGVPWADPTKAGLGARNWYKLEGGSGVVNLPSDVVEHGVEGVYRRSHCWMMAEQWSASNPPMSAALHEQEADQSAPAASAAHAIRESFGGPLPAPPSPAGLLGPDSRIGSPSRISNRNSSLGIGLEALPLPMGVTPDGSAPIERPRSSHNVDANKTFDAILADVNAQKKGKRK